jgi:hypothetical protein
VVLGACGEKASLPRYSSHLDESDHLSLNFDYVAAGCTSIADDEARVDHRETHITNPVLVVHPAPDRLIVSLVPGGLRNAWTQNNRPIRTVSSDRELTRPAILSEALQGAASNGSIAAWSRLKRTPMDSALRDAGD